MEGGQLLSRAAEHRSKWDLRCRRPRDCVPGERSRVPSHQVACGLTGVCGCWSRGGTQAGGRFIAGREAGREPENLGLGQEENQGVVVLFARLGERGREASRTA